MKKVVLSSVVTLSLFAVAAPVFAQGENSESSNQLIQKKYSSWRDSADEANTQVAAHEAEINAEAEKDAAVVAAKAALEQYGSGHEYGKYAEKVEEARTEARNTVRNKYVAQLQDKYTAAAKSQGNYYNETGPEANRTNEQRIADDKAAQGQAGQAGQNGQAGENGQKPASAAEAKASEAKAANGAKAGQKAAGKALPKTSAVK
ncbi:amylase-binding adhesin AbpA [Streptococcus cristatus]|uniref:Amylase-binding adhesin AbpA n=1 Tax=Streptococcus cristatus TaxID=45634 RepID=A0AAW5WQ26_STRCR|nr:amylase-binding adhesin AbpA [Streptococcus cristatus]MCY7222203.1 amylase-binding adhesin AbpA [Streptococcus cristatus]